MLLNQRKTFNYKEHTMGTTNAIRDIREKKGLSQDAVAEAAGITYSVFVRIEQGAGRTTEAEVKAVLSTLNKMKSTGKRVVGRPFGDPKTQAAVDAARELGTSVASVLSGEPVAATKAPRKRASRAKSK